MSEPQIGPPEPLHGNAPDSPTDRLRETLVQLLRSDVFVECGHGHGHVAVRLPPCGREEEREADPLFPGCRNHGNQLDEQRVEISPTSEYTTKADRLISHLCQQDVILPNLGDVVLDRPDEGRLADCLDPPDPATILLSAMVEK